MGGHYEVRTLPDERKGEDHVRVRTARTEDATEVAALCDQLEYPSTPQQIQQRLRQLEDDPHHAIYIAMLPDGRVVGWVQVMVRKLVAADLRAEIEGLVVDAGHRQQGIGRALMQQAEDWARQQGCGAIQLRSNVVREDAHIFYERVGYRAIKTQSTFRKPLAEE